jgi:hypothetical protein
VGVIEDQIDPTPPLPLDYAAPPQGVRARLRQWLSTPNPKFQIGTLRYTGFGLMMVFVWLLWGDFCFQLLDQNIPGLLPLELKKLGAGDTTNSFVNGTLSYAITFFLAPIVSVHSDRLRSRWGRRIPYLLWSTPFVGLFLILIGCYEPLTHWFVGNAPSVKVMGMDVARTSMAVFILGVLIIGFDLANIFVNTVYYYLFNDVVPHAYLSRFFSLFRIVISLAGMAYNAWVFPHSETHFRAIFVAAGIAYAVGFTAMCFFVREGEYPPPPEDGIARDGLLASVQTYARECFTHKLYWFFFLANACTFSSRLVDLFRQVRNTTSLGLTRAEIGDFSVWMIFFALLLQYPAGWVSDRWHPLRVYLLASIWMLFGTVAQCVWIFKDFGHHGNLVYLYISGLSFMPLGLVADAAELPMYMRLLPRDRYGQFASANAMVRAFAKIFLSVAVGKFLESLKPYYGEYRYTFIAAWQFVFQLAAAVFLVLLYRQWKLHGGNENYIPPGTK